jgi:hypothetical protein
MLDILKWTKKVIYTLQSALKILVNNQKEVKMCKNCPLF